MTGQYDRDSGSQTGPGDTTSFTASIDMGLGGASAGGSGGAGGLDPVSDGLGAADSPGPTVSGSMDDIDSKIDELLT